MGSSRASWCARWRRTESRSPPSAWAAMGTCNTCACLKSSERAAMDRFDHLRLNRYAAQNENFVSVVPRIAVLGRAERAKDTGNQPRGSAGISRGGAHWLVHRLDHLIDSFDR